MREPESEGRDPSSRTYRTLLYTRLSDTANVDVYADPAEGKVHVMLAGKYIGPPID